MTSTTAFSPSDVLTRTVEDLSNAHSLERVTQIVTAAVRALTGCDGATFVLREDDKCFYVDENAIGPMWKGLRFPLTACISGWAMLNKQVVIIPDIYADERIPHDAYRPTFVKSLCMTPIRSADPIGSMGAYWAEEHVPTPTQVRQLEVLANSAAVALENLELRGTVVRRVAELDQATARAGELEAAIHTMVHDLRSPLGAMLGYAELIDEEVETDPAAARAFARTIVRNGRRMAEQIDTMLALYRITRQPLEPSYVDLSAVATDLADSLTAQVRERDVRFEVEEGLSAFADPVLTRLLLENLMSNAVKYTGHTAAAVVTLRHVETAGGFSTFVVSDNGDGFDQSEVHRLFHPMGRLHSDEEFPGTGLGLASVARIVDAHGGTIRAQGTKGAGASFFFSLPSSA
jgi:signal transduction histidine kinase